MEEAGRKTYSAFRRGAVFGMRWHFKKGKHKLCGKAGALVTANVHACFGYNWGAWTMLKLVAQRVPSES